MELWIIIKFLHSKGDCQESGLWLYSCMSHTWNAHFFLEALSHSQLWENFWIKIRKVRVSMREKRCYVWIQWWKYFLISFSVNVGVVEIDILSSANVVELCLASVAVSQCLPRMQTDRKSRESVVQAGSCWWSLEEIMTFWNIMTS